MSDALSADLRAYFRESSRTRLAEIALLLGREPLDLATLARHFHAFSGLGATYGFPRVSELGDEAEGLILPFVRGGGSPDANAVARWRELAAEIERELW